jgi:hypothetical protein
LQPPEYTCKLIHASAVLPFSIRTRLVQIIESMYYNRQWHSLQ